MSQPKNPVRDREKTLVGREHTAGKHAALRRFATGLTIGDPRTGGFSFAHCVTLLMEQRKEPAMKWLEIAAVVTATALKIAQILKKK